jgi:hypothetical protein
VPTLKLVYGLLHCQIASKRDPVIATKNNPLVA